MTESAFRLPPSAVGGGRSAVSEGTKRRFRDDSFGDDSAILRLDDRHAVRVLLHEFEIQIDIDEFGVLLTKHRARNRDAFQTERASLPRIDQDAHGG